MRPSQRGGADLLICRFQELSSSKDSDPARHPNAGLRSRPQPAGPRPAPQGPALIRRCTTLWRPV